MINSRVIARLRSGEVIRVVSIGRVTDPWLVELAGRIGFDVIWLDMEHRPLGYERVAPMALACRATGMDLMVRVLKTDYSSPMRALEEGAAGVMVPHCRSAAEARQWVEWCRFPPLGRRGFDGAGADADYLLAPPLEYLRHANEQTFVVVQIEDPEAVECVGEIAAVEGVDVLFVGPADLSISYGVPFQTGHPLMECAITRVAEAAMRHGKAWGIACPNSEAAQQFCDRGAHMITCGSDHGWLVRGMQKAFDDYAGVRRKPPR